MSRVNPAEYRSGRKKESHRRCQIVGEMKRGTSKRVGARFSRTSRAVGLVLQGRIAETHGFISMVLEPVSSTLLSFIPRSLRLTRVLPTRELVTIEAVPRPTSADCSTCRTSSRRVHSRCRRRPYDLPWQRRPVTIQLAARRFRCLNRGCARLIFAERLPEIVHLS
jgi:hypothetical protein